MRKAEFPESPSTVSVGIPYTDKVDHEEVLCEMVRLSIVWTSIYFPNIDIAQTETSSMQVNVLFTISL